MPHALTDEAGRRALSSANVRARLLATMPMTERRLDLGGISTAVLEGGEGPPILLLHGPGEYAAKWLRVVPQLVRRHRVIAPDLPGHGTTLAPDGAISPTAVLAWLGALIGETCPGPVTLVGHLLGGAIAAKFAAGYRDWVDRLVLVDALGLAPFAPTPDFGQALGAFAAAPDATTHDGLWRQCAFDLDRLRTEMANDWDLMKAYNIDRAQTAAHRATQQSLFERFVLPAIAPAELQSITASTALIWGRHDRATPLAAAEAVSQRHGWPLFIIENCADDPPVEQPAQFLATIQRALRPA